MQINVKDNFRVAGKAIDLQAKQTRFAMAVAMTRTAQDVRKADLQEMRAKFDRPTSFTMNSLFVEPATKAKLSARVWFKQGNRPTHYLEPQVMGGERALKRFEEILVRAGFMVRSERAVPGEALQLDAAGNVSRGQIVKILSQLKAFNLAGSSQNASKSQRSTRKRAKEEYFVSRGRGTWVGGGSWKNGEKSQHLPRGIWVRRGFGAWGTAVRPVFLFVSRATYSKRFPFFEVSQRVVRDRLPSHFAKAYADAIRTARP